MMMKWPRVDCADFLEDLAEPSRFSSFSLPAGINSSTRVDLGEGC